MNNDDTAEFISNLHIAYANMNTPHIRTSHISHTFVIASDIACASIDVAASGRLTETESRFMFIANAKALTINKYYDCVTNAAHSISISNLLAKQI